VNLVSHAQCNGREAGFSEVRAGMVEKEGNINLGLVEPEKTKKLKIRYARLGMGI
jgi:hypothetical protein